MKESLIKEINSLKRLADNQRNVNGFYAATLFISLFIYGCFGVYPLIKVVSAKQRTIINLKNLNQSLLDKKNSLSELDSQVTEARFYVKSLDAAISSKANVEEYLIALVNAAAKAGYRQKRLMVISTMDNKVNLGATFEGNYAQFYNLIHEIESLTRLTQIEDYNFSFKEGSSDITMLFSIFYSGDTY